MSLGTDFLLGSASAASCGIAGGDRTWLDLTGGTNTFELSVNQGSALTNQLAYDALRLDLA